MGDLGSIPGLRRVPPTHSSILAEKSGGYSLWGRRELDKMIAQLNTFTLGFPGGSDSKVSAHNAGDPGLIPGWGRSPGEGNGNPLQYSCLENPHGQRSLAGYSLWGHKESDVTERLTLSLFQHLRPTSYLLSDIKQETLILSKSFLNYKINQSIPTKML